MADTTTKRRSSFQFNTENLTRLKKNLVDVTQNATEVLYHKHPWLSQAMINIEATTGLKKRHVGIVMVSLPVLFYLSVRFSPILLSVGVMMYSIFMSVKSVEGNGDDRRTWLIYWLILNTISAAESVFGVIFSLLPGYTIVKGLFLIWCMMPCNRNGCVVTYYMLRPLLLRPVQLVDEILFGASLRFQSLVRNNKTLVATATIASNGIPPVVMNAIKKMD